jgi:hypothetical protein
VRCQRRSQLWVACLSMLRTIHDTRALERRRLVASVVWTGQEAYPT